MPNKSLLISELYDSPKSTRLNEADTTVVEETEVKQNTRHVTDEPDFR